jgi:hypothetical protein
MTREKRARLLGYQLSDIARSLEVLLSTGVLTRTQNPARLARMYCFAADEGAWLPELVALASTRTGRLVLRQALAESRTAPPNGSATRFTKTAKGAARARPVLDRRTAEPPHDSGPDEGRKETR